MPLERYRDVAEMPPPAAVPVPPASRAVDPALLERIVALSAFATSVTDRLYPPGVQRFSTIEAANASQEAALLARMRRTARRASTGGDVETGS